MVGMAWHGMARCDMIRYDTIRHHPSWCLWHPRRGSHTILFVVLHSFVPTHSRPSPHTTHTYIHTSIHTSIHTRCTATGNPTTRSSTSRRRRWWRRPTRGSRKQHSAILHGRFARSTDRTHHRLDCQSFLCGIRGRAPHHRKVPFLNGALHHITRKRIRIRIRPPSKQDARMKD